MPCVSNAFVKIRQFFLVILSYHPMLTYLTNLKAKLANTSQFLTFCSPVSNLEFGGQAFLTFIENEELQKAT